MLRGLDQEDWYSDVPHSDTYHPYRHGLGKWVRKYEYARALWPNERVKTTHHDKVQDKDHDQSTAGHASSSTNLNPSLPSNPSSMSGSNSKIDNAIKQPSSLPALSCALKGACTPLSSLPPLLLPPTLLTPLSSPTHPLPTSPPPPALSCALKAVFGDRTGAFIGVDFVGDDYDILTCAAVTNVQVNSTHTIYHQPLR